MTGNPYSGHIAERVLGADPVELVVLLYEELGRSIADARRALAGGSAPQRARAISRAMEIIGELAQAVNPAPAPQLARQLAELYSFLLDRLHTAHVHQLDPPLAEAERVARTLLEAWQGIRAAQIHSPAPFQPQDAPAVSLAG